MVRRPPVVDIIPLSYHSFIENVNRFKIYFSLHVPLLTRANHRHSLDPLLPGADYDDLLSVLPRYPETKTSILPFHYCAQLTSYFAVQPFPAATIPGHVCDSKSL